MSYIVATFDTDKNIWSHSIKDLNPRFTDLLINFNREDLNIITFNNLHIFYELREGDSIRSYDSFPKGNVRYVSIDKNAPLIVKRLTYKPDMRYRLKLWCENAGRKVSYDIVFNSPIPQQPFNSWTWDGTEWIAPKNYPEDDSKYLWNEEILNWEIVEDE